MPFNKHVQKNRFKAHQRVSDMEQYDYLSFLLPCRNARALTCDGGQVTEWGKVIGYAVWQDGSVSFVTKHGHVPHGTIFLALEWEDGHVVQVEPKDDKTNRARIYASRSAWVQRMRDVWEETEEEIASESEPFFAAIEAAVAEAPE